MVLAEKLVLIDKQQDFPATRAAAQRQQQFERALGDIAGPPGPAVVLLDAMRDAQMDHAIVDEPRQCVLDARDDRVRAAQPQGQRVILPAWRGGGGGGQRGVALDLDGKGG